MLLIGLAIVAETSIVLGALALAEEITLWQIALGAIVSGSFSAADMTLRRIMSAEIAGTLRLGQAMALDPVNNHATRMLGRRSAACCSRRSASTASTSWAGCST